MNKEDLISQLRSVTFESKIKIVIGSMESPSETRPEEFIDKTKPYVTMQAHTRKLDILPFDSFYSEINNDLKMLEKSDYKNITKYGIFILNVTNTRVRYAKIIY